MKKAKLSAVLTAVVLAVALTLACVGMTACGATLESITLNTNGATTTFEVGDEFSAAGLKVTAKMSDGTTQEIALKDCKFSNPNMTVAGEKEVTVTYQEVKATYKITVKEKNVKPPLPWTADFEVDPATKTAYELSAVQAALDGSDRLGPSDVDPTVSVGGMIVGDKVIFMIDAKAAGDAKLLIDFDHSAHGGSPVNKLIKFTVNNAEITTEADFNNGEEGHDHPAWMCYQKTLIGDVSLVKGQNTITLEFLGNGSNLKGIILDFSDGTTPPVPVKTLTGITADATGAKTAYYRESRFLSAGVAVTAKYSDESTESIALDKCELTAPDMSTAGTKTVKIAYEGKETTYEVTVSDYFNVAVSDTAKKFTLNAVDAILDDTINIDTVDNSVGGIAAANAPSMTFKFNAAAAGTAKLIYVCDDNFKGDAVKDHFALTVNDQAKALDGVSFVTPEADHIHTAWHCYHETPLGEIAVAAGPNTVKFDHATDFTNVRGIVLDFDTSEQPAPEKKSYTFEAEDAFLQEGCMVEYKSGVGASADMLVGGWSDTANPSAATFEIYAAAATTADLTLKLASGEAGKLGTIFTVSVDGQALPVADISFPAGTGTPGAPSWYLWTAATIPNVALKAGLNTVVVGKVGEGGGSNLDCIAFVSAVALTDVKDGTQVYRFDGTKANAHSEEVGDEPDHTGWLNGIAVGSTITYKIEAAAKTTAMLSMFIDHNNVSKPLAADVITITVGDNEVPTAARFASCGGTCPDNWHHAIECKLGTIELDAGVTTITFTFKAAMSNFNGIALVSDTALTAVTA